MRATRGQPHLKQDAARATPRRKPGPRIWRRGRESNSAACFPYEECISFRVRMARVIPSDATKRLSSRH
jgi:hypothetical protein